MEFEKVRNMIAEKMDMDPEEITEDTSFEDIRLVLIGGCRNEGDFKRVEELKRIVTDLGMEDKVIFEVNVMIMKRVIIV